MLRKGDENFSIFPKKKLKVHRLLLYDDIETDTEKSAECIKKKKIHDSPQFSHSSINQQQKKRKEKFLGISAFFSRTQHSKNSSFPLPMCFQLLADAAEKKNLDLAFCYWRALLCLLRLSLGRLTLM